MLPLRFAPLWGAVAWSGVALAILLSLLPADAAPVPVGGPPQHLAGYFLLASWFLGIYPRARYPLIGLGCFGLGAGLELLQTLSPTRHPALADALTNGAAILAALAAAYAGLGGWAARLERRLGVGPR
ncbi:MAG TPA: hypothetical protein VMU00_13480 [Steroidobacteraceae bacterium]|nr:hypothetical protein [Steroidobacteraceae bacterium]